MRHLFVEATIKKIGHCVEHLSFFRHRSIYALFFFFIFFILMVHWKWVWLHIALENVASGALAFVACHAGYTISIRRIGDVISSVGNYKIGKPFESNKNKRNKR